MQYIPSCIRIYKVFRFYFDGLSPGLHGRLDCPTVRLRLLKSSRFFFELILNCKLPTEKWPDRAENSQLMAQMTQFVSLTVEIVEIAPHARRPI